MLTTKTRGRGTRRFRFPPLTEDEIEKLESVPTAAAAHLGSCSCGKNGDSGRVLAEIADLLELALAHGHELAIQPHVYDYGMDINIGPSVLGAEEALGAEEIRALESAPYSAAKHGGTCAICNCGALLPIGPVLTLAAIPLNHGYGLTIRPHVDSDDIEIVIEPERAEDLIDRRIPELPGALAGLRKETGVRGVDA